jgi:hypothetical protein
VKDILAEDLKAMENKVKELSRQKGEMEKKLAEVSGKHANTEPKTMEANQTDGNTTDASQADTDQREDQADAAVAGGGGSGKKKLKLKACEWKIREIKKRPAYTWTQTKEDATAVWRIDSSVRIRMRGRV